MARCSVCGAYRFVMSGSVCVQCRREQDAAKHPRGLEELLGLWHGDEHSTGFWSPILALAVARVVRPKSAAHLLQVFYPSWPEWVHPDATSIITQAYRAYQTWDDKATRDAGAA